MQQAIFRRLHALFATALVVASITLCFSCTSSKTAANDKELALDSSVKTGELANGMTYFVQQNKEPNNRISLRLVVKTGSNNEEEDQRGVAHFIEHLAFNGTEHFKKDAIVSFFEEIGMNFGADLNAYTSFDETVYMLEIPADNPEFLEKAMLVLHDWACAVTFEPEEVEKERGVVTEEWRMRSLGVNGRFQDKFYPFIMEGSKYASRLPIGRMDVIKNVSRDRVVDYYKKWYRPELMSVIVVGDADTRLLEDSIKAAMSKIPSSIDRLKPSVFSVPERTEKAVLTVRDPEQTSTVVQIMAREAAYEPQHTYGQLKKHIQIEILDYILNLRLNEISMKADAPWLGAQVSSNTLTNLVNYNEMIFIPKDGMYEAALKTMLDEYDRLMLHGISAPELEGAKKVFLSSLESQWKNKDSITSSEKAGALISYALTGSTALSADTRFKLLKASLTEITEKDLDLAAQEIFADRGIVCVTLAPEQEKLELTPNFRTV